MSSSAAPRGLRGTTRCTWWIAATTPSSATVFLRRQDILTKRALEYPDRTSVLTRSRETPAPPALPPERPDSPADRQPSSARTSAKHRPRRHPRRTKCARVFTLLHTREAAVRFAALTLCYIQVRLHYGRACDSALAGSSLRHFPGRARAFAAAARISQASHPAGHRDLPTPRSHVRSRGRQDRSLLRGRDKNLARHHPDRAHRRSGAHQQQLLADLLATHHHCGNLFRPGRHPDLEHTGFGSLLLLPDPGSPAI